MDNAQKNTEETVEFYTPPLGFTVSSYIKTRDIQGIHHIARYQWASVALKKFMPKRIIDIACGAGYGSYMLAEELSSSEIVGVDYDPRAVEHANKNYQHVNLSYRTGSIVDFDKLGVCDAIVSFDTLEHIAHRDIALENIANTLDPKGVLFLSTPCSHDETHLNPEWEHHEIEYSHRDLFRFLSRYFRKIVRPQDKEFPNAKFWTDLNAKERLYPNLMNPVVCLEPIPSRPYP